MIDTDKYIEMWDDNLLGSEGVQILMNTLIAEVKRLRKGIIDIADKWEQPCIIRGFLKELKELIE